MILNAVSAVAVVSVTVVADTMHLPSCEAILSIVGPTGLHSDFVGLACWPFSAYDACHSYEPCDGL